MIKNIKNWVKSLIILYKASKNNFPDDPEDFVKAKFFLWKRDRLYKVLSFLKRF